MAKAVPTRTYTIEGVGVRAYWSFLMLAYVVITDDSKGSPVTTVVKEGSRWFTTAYPSRRFQSMKKALEYMADQQRHAH
jgi:hypothetical protein